RGPVVDLQVQPKHSEIDAPVPQRIYRVDNLLPSGAAAGGMAREQVGVDCVESSTPGVPHVLESTLIDAAIALAYAANVKLVVHVGHAPETGGRDGRDCVQANCGRGESDAEGKKNKGCALHCS
ncbi:hypothetical protein PENTCL1PPCAC_28769, partial [Pristionchus entomophagus]